MSSITINNSISHNSNTIGAKIKESAAFAGRKISDWTCSFAQNIQKIGQTALRLIAKVALVMAAVAATGVIMIAGLAVLGLKIVQRHVAGSIRWIEKNPVITLNMVKVAAAALMLSGFATMAVAPSIYATSQTIGCTMESCARIVHFALDPIFAKGLMTAVSGAAVIAVSNQIHDRIL